MLHAHKKDDATAREPVSSSETGSRLLFPHSHTMTIIYDFNRTIFDPETGTLMDGALTLLQIHTAEGHTLHLVSKREADREATLARLGIGKYFDSVQFVEEKQDALKALIEAAETPVYVIGDHLHSEIRLGNRLGARTIWLKRGRFADLRPEGPDDMPWRTISHLGELLEVALG